MKRQATNQITEIIGANIRAGRDRLRLTQHELALRIGSQAFEVSRWEKGRHRPQDETLAALADALEMDFADFFTEPEREAA